MTYLRLLPIWKTETGRIKNDLTPTVDIIEGEKGFTLDFDLPGFEKEDITLLVKKNILTVTGERKPSVAEDEKNFRYDERHSGTFSRSFRLPNHIEGENIKGSYKNGVLTLELPQKEEAKLHSIEIK